MTYTQDRTPEGSPASLDTTSVDGDSSAPRFPILPERLDEQQKAIHAQIESGPRGGVRGPLALMLYSADMAPHAQALGEFARYNSLFSPSLSELIILVVARRLDCNYEWSAHAPIATRTGIPASVADDIGRGVRPVFEDADQELVYDFVVELQETNRVRKPLFNRFRSRFGERGIVEATSIMGYYTMIAFMLNAVEVPPNGAALPARKTIA